jgi:broad specificity phosphatase PhoE
MDDTVKEKVLRIVLVRHGETDWNKVQRFQGQSNVGLNKKGKGQAGALAKALRKEPLRAIYSSPIARSIETAKIINCYHHVPLEQREGLMEMNVGDFEGFQPGEVMNKQPPFFKKWFEDPASVRMPNGETLQEVQERAWVVVEEIVDTYNERSVLMCGHNFVNLMILCKILGLEIINFRRIRQSLGAMNIIERVRGLYTLVCINDTSHLKGIDLPS